MYINGEWVQTDEQFTVFNKATNEPLGDVPNANAAQIEAAIQAAHVAYKTWRETTAYERAAYLYRCYELMLERQEALAQLMSSEQGKPLKAALNEVRYGADFLLWYAEEAKRNYGATIPSARHNQRFITTQQPVGVVAAITPWNYPISMITRKVAPALAAGCTVVLKPAEATPLCAQAMFEIFADAGLPAGVVNLVTVLNPRECGDIFCQHPLVKKITFTGSTAVGRYLGGLAGQHLKRVSMELGGHAPAIVFPDMDPIYAAKGLALVTFLNSGQACISPNRLYVHKDSAEAFLTELTSRVAKMKVGGGLEDGVAIGPLINAAAVEKVDAQVQDAISKGAQVLTGGKRLFTDEPNRGHFYAPTVLAGVTPEMHIYREETFGPVAPVIIYENIEDVIEQANDTEYGLAAYLYTNDLSTAIKTSEALEFGIIGVNDINPTSAAAPFGGIDHSGLGREGAREGLQEYLETKVCGIALS